MHKNYPSKRKPVIVIVCEGKNKTESNYFKNFISANYNLKIKDSEATDIQSMANKALQYYKDFDIRKKDNEHVFCVFDLDLDENKFNKFNKLASQKKYKNIEFIKSNPCFEIFILYYFTAHPKRENSSRNVKKQLCKYIPGYKENIDVIKTMNLYDKHLVAINNSENKNLNYEPNTTLTGLNPYSEIQNIITLLFELGK